MFSLSCLQLPTDTKQNNMFHWGERVCGFFSFSFFFAREEKNWVGNRYNIAADCQKKKEFRVDEQQKKKTKKERKKKNTVVAEKNLFMKWLSFLTVPLWK
jgi:hypothetical protein